MGRSGGQEAEARELDAVQERVLRGWTALDPVSEAVEANKPLAAALVGMTRDAAIAHVEAAGLSLRLLDWDAADGPLLLSLDLRGDRITIHIRGGLVAEADAG